MKKILFTFYGKNGELVIRNEQLVPDLDELETILTILLNFAKSGEIPFFDYFRLSMDFSSFLKVRNLITSEKSMDRVFRNENLVDSLTYGIERLNRFDGGQRKMELVVEEVLHPDYSKIKWVD